MTKNFKNAINKNNYIAQEVSKYGVIRNNTQLMRDRAPIFTKKKSIATRAKEASEARYTRRSNICDVCHTTKSSNNNCLCEE